MVKARGSLVSCMTNLCITISLSFPCELERYARYKNNIPAKTLLVVCVDLGSFLQLCNQFVDALLVILCVEVHNESVDHIDVL